MELETSTLNQVLPRDCDADLLVMDIQGAEYQAIVGLGDRISQFNFVYCEVNRAEVYKGIKQIEELDKLLNSLGFVRLAAIWTAANRGDALYARLTWARQAYCGEYLLRQRVKVFEILTALRKT
jgi:hypothetical protein